MTATDKSDSARQHRLEVEAELEYEEELKHDYVAAAADGVSMKAQRYGKFMRLLKPFIFIISAFGIDSYIRVTQLEKKHPQD